MKKIMVREDVGRLLEIIGKDIIENGRVEISGTMFDLPAELVVELEYKRKHEKNKLEIELKWYSKSTRPTSNIIPFKETLQSVKVATMDELSPWKAINFSYPKDTDKAILIVLPDIELRAYSTVCAHKGECVVWDSQLKQLHCPAHGAVFDPETGLKLKGPGGNSLNAVHLQIEEDGVYAVGIEY